MADDLYCSRADVTGELPLGELTESSGLLASSIASSNILTKDGHGLETDDEVKVRAVEGGTLSAPLAESTVYYAIRLTNSTFKLAATPGGSAIDLTTDGTDMVVMKEPNFDKAIEFRSRWVDTFFPAHVVPFGRDEAAHPLVRGIVARLTAADLLNANGKASEIVAAKEQAASKMLERLAKGIPLRGAPAPAPANLAVTSTLGSVSDPRGWGSRTIP